MNDIADNSWQDLAHCAGWEIHRFTDGPRIVLLMHAVSDAAGLLRGDRACSARASVRMMLGEGTIFGLVVSAPATDMLGVLREAGAVLEGQRYDESCFGELDAKLALALASAGFRRTQVALERDATVLPRPLLSSHQVERLALGAVNTALVMRGGAALPALPGWVAARFALGCSWDHPALREYRALLEPNAVAFQAGARQASAIAPDRLAVYNFIGAARANARNRAQAMAALPWLLPMMTAPGGAANRSEVLVIRDAIDHGLPLFDAVAGVFAVPREVVRWLGRRTLPRNWAIDVGRTRRLLALLSWLAPERRPRTIAQFDALTALGSAVAAPFAFHDTDDKPALLARVAPCMRRWLADVTRPGLDAAAAAPAFAQLASDLADAGDFLRALAEGLQVIDRLDCESGFDRLLSWCAALPAPRLLALSRDWHAATAALPGATAGADAGLRWPAVLARPWQHAQLTVTELASSALLRMEGQALLHCVGSFGESCHRGNSVIVSLRATSGKPVSTAELHLGTGSPCVVAGQHRAARNAVPSAECVRALGAFVAYLNKAENRDLLCARQDFQRRQRAHARPAPEACSHAAMHAARRLAVEAMASSPL